MNRGSEEIGGGGCYCGAVTFQFAQRLEAFVNCHCTQCRRASGAAFTSWVCPPSLSFVVDGRDSLSIFTMTPNVSRHFCSVCGTHVYSFDARRPDIVGLPAGVITTPISGMPTEDCFFADRSPWLCSGSGKAEQP